MTRQPGGNGMGAVEREIVRRVESVGVGHRRRVLIITSALMEVYSWSWRQPASAKPAASCAHSNAGVSPTTPANTCERGGWSTVSLFGLWFGLSVNNLNDGAAVARRSWGRGRVLMPLVSPFAVAYTIRYYNREESSQSAKTLLLLTVWLAALSRYAIMS